jgi:hypothetical protein
MPKIESWDHSPAGVRQHLIDRMRDRVISISDLNQFRLWIDSKPTKTSARSRSAAADQPRKRFFFAVRPPRETPSKRIPAPLNR